MYFRSPSSAIAPLNRQFELQDSILRHLVLKIHPHLVEAVLEHAQAGPAPPAPHPVVAAGPALDIRMPEEELN
jgi:hypothetical protein